MKLQKKNKTPFCSLIDLLYDFLSNEAKDSVVAQITKMNKNIVTASNEEKTNLIAELEYALSEIECDFSKITKEEKDLKTKTQAKAEFFKQIKDANTLLLPIPIS